MMYLRYVLFAILTNIVNLLVILLSPFLSAWSVIANINVLPYPFNLLHTHDDDLDGGQHQLGWPKETGTSLWIQRMKWICRNPGYGFDAHILGFKTEGVVFEKNEVYWANAHDCKIKVIMRAANGKKYFSYRYQKQYGNRYLKLWLGWHYEAKDGKHHMLKFDFHPFRKA